MPKATRQLPLAPVGASPRGDSVGDTIKEATSHDLVFAVVGHAGAGASWVAKALAEGLKSHPYEPVILKVSELICEAALAADRQKWRKLEQVNLPRGARTLLLQEAGNWLRDTHGRTFTAALAIRHMHDHRQKRVTERRVAYVLDSLKNPQEVDALRKVYGRSFYLVSVVCGPAKREARLQIKFKNDPENLAHVVRHDEAQEESYGQQVRKTLHLADFFVNNEANVEAALPDSPPAPLDQALARFLQIVFATEVVRPTRDERGMYAAWAAALRSSCLSRQVGAAILNAEGQLIATGTNDVPKFGGGLYEEDELGSGGDHRCFHTGYCRNDQAKHEILVEAVRKLREAGVVAKATQDSAIVAALRKTPLNDLIEFSRAVHAEMDAIVSLARSGGSATRDGTLYCTTYPCHSCARHVVAAGICDVVYIEPYVKSRAVELHSDAIEETTVPPTENSKRVHFRLFTGVAPRRYAALFEKRQELKKDGHLSLAPDADALHTDPIFTKSHLEFEQLIAKHVKEATGDKR